MATGCTTFYYMFTTFSIKIEKVRENPRRLEKVGEGRESSMKLEKVGKVRESVRNLEKV